MEKRNPTGDVTPPSTCETTQPTVHECKCGGKCGGACGGKCSGTCGGGKCGGGCHCEHEHH